MTHRRLQASSHAPGCEELDLGSELKVVGHIVDVYNVVAENVHFMASIACEQNGKMTGKGDLYLDIQQNKALHIVLDGFFYSRSRTLMARWVITLDPDKAQEKHGTEFESFQEVECN